MDCRPGLLSTPARMSHISQALVGLVEPLTQHRARDVVAEMVLEILWAKKGLL